MRSTPLVKPQLSKLWQLKGTYTVYVHTASTVHENISQHPRVHVCTVHVPLSFFAQRVNFICSHRKYHGSVLTAVKQKQGLISSEAPVNGGGPQLEHSKKWLTHRDEEHYLQYTPSDAHSERG